MKNKLQGLKYLIKKAKFDWVNDNITPKNFPDKHIRGKVELIHLHKGISSEDAIKEMYEKGYIPANILELVQFSIDNPEKQREFPIVALGSVWQCPNGYRLVTCLYRGVSERSLDLAWFGGGWGSSYRFAACRKETYDERLKERILDRVEDRDALFLRISELETFRKKVESMLII